MKKRMSLKVVKTLCAVGMAAALGSTVVFAQNFSVIYDFSSVTANAGGTTDPTPPPTATGVTFGSFAAFGLSGNPNAGGRFSFTTNALGGINGDNNFGNFTGSIDLAKYFEVTLTPQAGYTLDLDSIAFTIQRSGTGIRSYAVRSDVDGFAGNLPASINPANANLTVGAGNEFQWVFDATTSAQNGSLVTLGSGFDTLSSAVTFRFYGWNAEGDGGTFSIDNVNFSGAVVAVPEPTALAILGLGGMALLLRRRN
jgi:trimeric autotransporter adhesin